MKLRLILIVLTIGTLVSVMAGGYAHYTSIKHSVLIESEMQTVLMAEKAQTQFADFLSENKRFIKKLAEQQPLSLAITKPSDPIMEKANSVLDTFNQRHPADICFVMDAEGLVLASSNRDKPDSFVGNNYDFRPYFKNAILGSTDVYMALGVTSGKRGIYYSHPVYAPPYCKPVGVAVIKSSLDELENLWQSQSDNQDQITVVTNPQGLIFIANHRQWLFQLLWEIPEAVANDMAATRQFGTGPWRWTGISRMSDYRAKDLDEVQYLMHSIDLHFYPGWRITQLSNYQAVSQHLFGSAMKKAGLTIGGICLLIGGLLYSLFRIANQELARRQAAEENLKHEHGILDSIVTASPVGIGLIENRTFKWANKAMRDIFNVSDINAFDNQSTRMIYASDSEYERVGDRVYSLASKGLPAECDALLKRSDGTLFTGHVTINATNPSHPRQQAILIIADITARVQSEEDRLKREKLHSVLETAGAVCHELNQPLMAINGLCAIGLSESDRNHPAYHRFERVLDEVNRMANITKQLSSITRYRTRDYIRGTKIIDIEKSSVPPEEDDPEAQ